MNSSTRSPIGAWEVSARLITRWLEQRERVDTLLESQPAKLSSIERARCLHWVYGVIRHYGRLEATLGRLIAHSPRFSTRAVLLLAGYELIEVVSKAEQDATSLVPKIVHHAVEHAKRLTSPAEARLVNAVVRKMAPLLAQPAPPKLAEPEQLAEYFSHPEWLVRRWLLAFGAEATRRLLEWNQRPARISVRLRPPHGDEATEETLPRFLKPTEWAGFYDTEPGHWGELNALLKAGRVYLQDPATRLAVGALRLQPKETLLDLCSAPGGKAILAADTAPKLAQIVALDLPSPRIAPLKQNLSTIRDTPVALVQADLLTEAKEALREHALPLSYDAVMLDAPCSNTGVIRRRIDAKWRLQERDFRKHAKQQLSLLHAAARFVHPGGRLVYSTCSIEAEENTAVVRSFMGSQAGGTAFTLERSTMSYPWESGHDGAGVFLLRKRLTSF